MMNEKKSTSFKEQLKERIKNTGEKLKVASQVIKEKASDFGEYLNEKKEFVFTGERPLIKDLDTLPMPAYHLYNMEHPYIGLPSEGDRGFVVNFARGCSYDCSFCSESAVWQRTWRTAAQTFASARSTATVSPRPLPGYAV